MIFSKTDSRRLQFIAYFIVIATFGISIAFPMLLQFTEPYAAPTAVYSEMIVNKGHLVQLEALPPDDPVYWINTLSIESQYPVPSILVATLILITGIPFHYAMFIPLVAIGNLIYFVLARYILSKINNNKGLVWVFSALFYLYFSVSTIAGVTIGRASLGIMFLAFFIYIYLRFGSESNVHSYRYRYFGSILTLVLLVIIIGFNYYFATIDVIALMTLIIIATILGKNALPRKRPFLEGSILVMAIFLFLRSTVMVAQIQTTTVTKIFSSFLEYIGSMVGMLGIQLDWLNTGPSLWNINLVNLDLLSSLGNRVLLVTQYSSIIVMIACILIYRPKKFQRSPKDIIWLFCIIILFASVGELGYLTTGPYSPLRLLLYFGPIVTLAVVLGFISENYKNGKLTVGKIKFVKLKLIIFGLVTLFFCISILGSVNMATTYGVAAAKLSAYNTVYPVSSFLCSYVRDNNSIILTGDSGYTSNIFFISSLNNKTDSVIAEPLLGDSITLNEAIATGDSQIFVSAMKYRQIQYLLIIDNGKPIYGDVWGYIIEAPNADTISKLDFSLIYTDGVVQLFEVF